MICDRCKTETMLDGTCPACIAYAKQATPRYAEGYYIDFSDLSERERSAFTRFFGDAAPCVK